MTIDLFGTLAFGELPSEYSGAVANPFAALLTDPEAQIIYLVELYPYDPELETSLTGESPFGSASFGESDIALVGGVERQYLSNLGFTTTPDDSVANIHFPAQVDNPMQFDVSISSGGDFGSSAPSYGSIVISNADGGLDGLDGYLWTGRRAVVKAGSPDFAYDDFASVFIGVVNGIESDEDKITLTIRDNRLKTDQLLQPNDYAGTGSTEGGSDLANTPKPLCFGEVVNIEPVLVDPVNLIYQVHDGSILAVDAVRDSGSALTFQADVADITATSVTAGQYKTQLTGGYIKLGSTPSGRITADVRGANSGSYVSTAGDITQRILTNYLGARSFDSTDIDAGAFNTLDTVLGGDTGVYITDKTTASDIIDALINPCGAYWTFTRLGQITVGYIDDPGYFVLEIGENDIDERGVEITATIPPAWKISLGYAPVSVVQKEDELAGSTTTAIRTLVGEKYRYVVDEDEIVRAQNEHAVERSFFTQIADQADAQTLLTRLTRIYGVKRRIYRVPVWKMLFRVFIGDVVNITYPRYGLDAGVNLLVTGISEDLESGITTLELWG